jgi:FlaA1/EpsC-like NDP-sugar epimerase
VHCITHRMLLLVACSKIMFASYMHFMSQRDGNVWWGFLNFKFQKQKQRWKNCQKGVFFTFVLFGYVMLCYVFFFFLLCLQDSEVLEFLCYFIVAHILFMFVDCSRFSSRGMVMCETNRMQETKRLFFYLSFSWF